MRIQDAIDGPAEAHAVQSAARVLTERRQVGGVQAEWTVVRQGRAGQTGAAQLPRAEVPVHVAPAQ
jgi:hypothetical protein